jgi:hypothetical protein
VRWSAGWSSGRVETLDPVTVHPLADRRAHPRPVLFDD